MLRAYTRPRYQVSVYRTIGPLVILIVGPDIRWAFTGPLVIWLFKGIHLSSVFRNRLLTAMAYFGQKLAWI